MTEAERVADELKRAFRGGAWHGPALFEVLEGIEAEHAAQRPLGPARSIWEITLHVGAWFPTVERRLRGEAVQLSDAEDWPEVRGASVSRWTETQATLSSAADHLVDAVLGLSPQALAARVPGKDYDAAFMLHGVAQHVAYHAGQIAILKKASPDQGRDALRHALATLAYRGGKAIRAAPPTFATYRPAPGSRTPLAILAHIADLLDWAVVLADGRQDWRDAEPTDWEVEVGRFRLGLEAFDARLRSPKPLAAPVERLFQGPIADALTHVGQIAMLRRIAGAPIRAENYFKADIQAGRLGEDQSTPRREF